MLYLCYTNVIYLPLQYVLKVESSRIEKECTHICTILGGTWKVKRSLSLNTPDFPKPFKV